MSGASQFTRFGTFNAVLPVEGPKTYPFKLDFTTLNERVIDMQIEVDAKHISYISGIVFDNRLNANALEVLVERVGQSVGIPAGKQGQLPLLCTDTPVLTIRTTPAANLIIPFFVCNFPVAPILF
jgi:hypothetical protein